MSMDGGCVDDDQILTQYGDDAYFRDRPSRGQTQMSVQAGQRTPAEMAQIVLGAAAAGEENPRARYTTAGRLRKNGFTVDQWGRDPNHVSVGYPGAWNERRRQAFNDAFEADGDDE